MNTIDKNRDVKSINIDMTGLREKPLKNKGSPA